MHQASFHSRQDRLQEAGTLAAARAVQRDFADLIMMFDRQLAGLCSNDPAGRAHVTKAKAAAERGLQLSMELIETLPR
jgi:hypothetical protein